MTDRPAEVTYHGSCEKCGQLLLNHDATTCALLRIAAATERIAAKLDLALIEPDLRCPKCSGSGRREMVDDKGKVHGIMKCHDCHGTGGKLLDPETGKPVKPA